MKIERYGRYEPLFNVIGGYSLYHS